MNDRQYFYLTEPRVRTACLKAINEALDGARVQIEAPKRSLNQEARSWIMLGDIAGQLEHDGVKLPASEWRQIFLEAFGEKPRAVRSLEGLRVVLIPPTSSTFDREKMRDFLAFIRIEAERRGVAFSEPAPKAEQRGSAA